MRAAVVRWFYDSGLRPYRAASATLVVGSAAAAVGIDRAENDLALWLCVAGSVGAAGLNWWIGEARARTLAAERDATRGEVLVDLGHSLSPLALEIARVCALPIGQRRIERSGLVVAVLAAATGLAANTAHLRASYFCDNGLVGPARAMDHFRSTGRSIVAKAKFAAGTVSGDTALAMIDAGRYLHCEDVREDPPPGWEQSQRGSYETFISVTVSAAGRPFGMLTLDAEEAGTLKVEDLQMMIVLGHLLGIVEALTS